MFFVPRLRLRLPLKPFQNTANSQHRTHSFQLPPTSLTRRNSCFTAPKSLLNPRMSSGTHTPSPRWRSPRGKRGHVWAGRAAGQHHGGGQLPSPERSSPCAASCNLWGGFGGFLTSTESLYSSFQGGNDYCVVPGREELPLPYGSRTAEGYSIHTHVFSRCLRQEQEDHCLPVLCRSECQKGL